MSEGMAVTGSARAAPGGVAPLLRPADERLLRARRDLRLRTQRGLDLIRLIAGVLFLALSACLGYLRGRADWRMNVPMLAAFSALALALYLVSGKDTARDLRFRVAPSLDVLVVFALQYASMPASPFPAGVAGWSLGLFVFLILLASLTLERGMIVWIAGLSWVCEGMLQRAAGVGYGAVAASGVVLGVSAAITVFAARRIDELVERVVREEVAAQLEHERSEELRRTQEQLQAAHEALGAKHGKLQLAQREAERLTRVLVHDMKGPLTSILSLTELAAETVKGGSAGSAVAGDLEIVQREAQRLLGMISDLLAIARLEDGALKPQRSTSPVYAMLSELQDAYRAEAKRRNVSLTARAPVDLVADFDRSLTRRIIENLVQNALRFVKSGDRIEMEGRRQGAELWLNVRNSGPPVPAEMRRMMFEKYSTSSSGKDNVGLGLYFCRLAAESQGGNIALENDAGWPVSFVLRIAQTRA